MEVLEQHKQVWDRKVILRDIYFDWYRMIDGDLLRSAKPTLEIGAGTGNFKEFKQNVIASDIVPCAWIDACFDAHKIPFEDQAFSNIVMIDVLHHLNDPLAFLDEAYRALEPGGRLALLEPYPSPFSKIVYKKVHPEPFLFDVDYFSKQKNNPQKDPWDSNQAIAYLLFFQNEQRLADRMRGKLSITRRKRLSFLRYPLSGGFSNPAFYPEFAVPLMKLSETLLSPFSPLLAFRCYVVLVKAAQPPNG